jgi:hypothetical protein
MLTLIGLTAGISAQEDCDIACPRIYWPVCATDGVIYESFASSCYLRQYNCQNPQGRKLSKN